MKINLHHVKEEFCGHLPYTIFSSACGITFVGILSFISILLEEQRLPMAAKELFHVFHPIHLLLSATATTAMFWLHEKGLIKTIIIGFVGAVGVCGISDIIIPFIGGVVLGVKMHLHICILEHPQVILPFVGMGIFAGFIASETIHRSTVFSHAGHVCVSSMASILYLVSFGLSEWMHKVGLVFVVIVIAV
ncbi:MAG: hypothetical protein QME40_06970, partial [bacterium]|nr:hypothetical protein [bacterium]